MRLVSYNFLHSYSSERDVGESVRAPIATTAVSKGTAMMLYQYIAALG